MIKNKRQLLYFLMIFSLSIIAFTSCSKPVNPTIEENKGKEEVKEKKNTVVDITSREKIEIKSPPKSEKKDDKNVKKKKVKTKSTGEKKTVNPQKTQSKSKPKDTQRENTIIKVIDNPSKNKATNNSGNQNTNVSDKKPSQKPTEPKPEKKDEIIKKKVVLTTEIPFQIIDKYKDVGGKTKVIQEGVNGSQKLEEEVTYKNGEIVARKEISKEIVSKPKEKIIARYIKVQDEVKEEVEVEDKEKPIYEDKIITSWKVINKKTDETKTFDDQKEATVYISKLKEENIEFELQEEKETVKEIVGYEKKVEEKIIQEEKWEWKY